MKKIIYGLISIGIIGASIAGLMYAKNSNNSKENENASIDIEKNGNEEKPLEELGKEYLIIDGVEYFLPMQYDTLVERGWTFNSDEWTSDENKTLLNIPAGKYTGVFTGVYKDGKKIVREMSFSNQSDTIKSYQECDIRCYLNGARPDPDKGGVAANFEITGGITADSKVDEVRKIFTSPDAEKYFQFEEHESNDSAGRKFTFFTITLKDDNDKYKYNFYTFSFWEDGVMRTAGCYISI